MMLYDPETPRLSPLSSNRLLDPHFANHADTSAQFPFPANDQIPKRRCEPLVSDGLSPDIAFLRSFGLDLPTLVGAQARAAKLDVSPAQALIAGGMISESDYFRCVASHLNLSFAETPPDAAGDPFFELPTPNDLRDMAKMVASSGPGKLFYIAPDMRHSGGLARLLERLPGARSRILVTTTTANLKALEVRCRDGLVRSAVDGLANRWPRLSAKHTISAAQAAVLLIMFQIVVAIALFASSLLVLLAHLISASFYLGVVLVRILACLYLLSGRKPLSAANNLAAKRASAGPLPQYAVLVPLYQEAGQIHDLLAALNRLDWPREKLDIALICEADDFETLKAARRAVTALGASHIRVIAVPPGLPRTKPKALNYALPLCRGDLVVVYDAEDRPDPEQLKEAHQAFLGGGDLLVCVQAPLIVHNHAENHWSCMFAAEYAALFDGLLPMLASRNWPMPLGGTSNHFRRDALVAAGCWDPYNVTEDADLGTRLARMGLQVGVIERPTYEEAPIDYDVWLKQRSRWFKGWYQTWLVHMRQPFRTIKDLGWRHFVIFQTLIAGMILCALIHPLLLVHIGYKTTLAWLHGPQILLSNPFFWLDLLTVLLGYAAMITLSLMTLQGQQRRNYLKTLWFLPVYWLAISAAAWRAAWLLLRMPHDWEKTPHRLHT